MYSPLLVRGSDFVYLAKSGWRFGNAWSSKVEFVILLFRFESSICMFSWKLHKNLNQSLYLRLERLLTRIKVLDPHKCQPKLF